MSNDTKRINLVAQYQEEFPMSDVLLAPLHTLSDTQLKELLVALGRETYKRSRAKRVANFARTFVLHFADGSTKDISGSGLSRDEALQNAMVSAGLNAKKLKSELDYLTEKRSD